MPQITNYNHVSLNDLIIQPTIHTREGDRKDLKESLPSNIENYKNRAQQAMMFTDLALKQAGNVMQKMDDVRKKNIADPLQNKISKKVNTYRYCAAKRMELLKSTTKAKGKLSRLIGTIDSETGPPPGVGSEIEPFAAEIRNHIKGLDFNKRQEFFYNQIQNQQWDTLSVVLSAKPFLSGLSQDQHTQLVKDYRSARYPVELQTRRTLEKAYATIEATEKDVFAKTERLNSSQVKAAMNTHENASESMEGLSVYNYNDQSA